MNPEYLYISYKFTYDFTEINMALKDKKNIWNQFLSLLFNEMFLA